MKSVIRHCWLICLLILVLSGNIFAQLSTREKLLLQISKETDDTSKAKLLITFGTVYFQNEELMAPNSLARNR